MIRALPVLILAVLTGCASIRVPVVQQAPPAAAQGLTGTVLPTTPPRLQQVLLKAGVTEVASLADTVQHTTQSELLPDTAFARAHAVVTGDGGDLRSHYATALGAYITQADFSCRQPVYARYFQQRYADASPTPCQEPIPLLVMTRYEGAKLLRLDPHRIQSVRLLFAGNSRSLASRFGHVAIHLVICPEGSNEPARCETNLFQHIVLGYQAQVDDFSLDVLKALRGGYQAQLFANNFMDSYEQYAIGEFREIYSLPLRLDATQREQLVRELAEIHWRFSGDYRFLTRNCATLLQDALRTSWPAFAADTQASQGYLRPDHFFAAMAASPLSEGDRLNPHKQAEHEGYYFSSTRPFYEKALLEVQTHMSTPAVASLDNYLATAPQQRLSRMRSDEAFHQQLASNAHLREAQLMLEEYTFLRGERQLLAEGARYLQEQDFLARENELTQALSADEAQVIDDCLLSPIRQYLRPPRRLSGIPAEAALPASAALRSTCRQAGVQRQLQDSIARVHGDRSARWHRLQSVAANLAATRDNIDYLKALAPPATGF